MDQIDLFGKARKVKRVLKSRVSASDDRDRFPLKEGSVADRAVGDPAPNELVLALDAEPTAGGADRKNDRRGRVGAAVALDGEMTAFARDAKNVLKGDFATAALRLLKERGGLVNAADVGKRGVVFNQSGTRDLPSDRFPLEDQNALSCARSVDAGGQPRRTAADDDDIIFHMIYYLLIYARIFETPTIFATESPEKARRVGACRIPCSLAKAGFSSALIAS